MLDDLSFFIKKMIFLTNNGFKIFVFLQWRHRLKMGLTGP